MERDGGAVARRTLLSGALGTVGLAVTGCSTPPAPVPTATKPSPVITSVRPRSEPSKTTRPASAREIIKRATVPVLCYHQLRNWTSSDSQYNRVNLICSDKAYRHLSKAGYKTAFQLKAKRLDPSAPLYTLRRTLAVSTWSGAKLLQHLKRQHP
jgi:hypothetical protein